MYEKKNPWICHRVTCIYVTSLLHTIISQYNNGSISSYWITYKKLRVRVFYTPISLTRLHNLIGNCLGSDTNQCTSQVNPGEIEIHLLTSDCNQSALRQVHLSFKKKNHRTVAQWGTTVEGKQRRLHLRLCRLLCRRCWWCSGKNTWGCVQRTNADWQRPVGGLGWMSGASDPLWVWLMDWIYMCSASDLFAENWLSDTESEADYELFTGGLNSTS